MLKTIKLKAIAAIAIFSVMAILALLFFTPLQGSCCSLGTTGTRASPRLGPLNNEEQRWAAIAWQYFQNNTQPNTGLVNAQDNYPTTSLWQIGDTLVAMTAAKQLQLIEAKEFDQRLTKILTTLGTLPLTPSGVPNLRYDTQKGSLSDEKRQPNPSGWSTQDLARLLLGLNMVVNYAPEYRSFVDRIILRWNFCPIMTPDGQLLNANVQAGKWQKIPESDIGYGGYSASIFGLWGFQPTQTAQLPFKRAIISAIPIDFSAQDPRTSGVPVVVESTPYLLDGLEFNWQVPSSLGLASSPQQPRAEAMYLVQELRWQQQKILTARASYTRTSAPWLVHNSIFANGYAWNTLADDGTYRSDLALLSTKAIFGLWVLWDTPFTDALMTLGRWHHDEKRGWFEGRDEKSGGHNRAFSLSTNAMVLEALFYKSNHGFLIRHAATESYLDAYLKEQTNWPQHCLPQEGGSLRKNQTD